MRFFRSEWRSIKSLMAEAAVSSPDWQALLTAWSQDLMRTELAAFVQLPADSRDWLGYAPASEAELKKLERRLRIELPPSYRLFLQTSNGWRRTTSSVGRLRPTTEVDWFRAENEQAVALYSETGSELSDEEYYAYREDGAPHHHAEHMSSLLQISDFDDGVYLLNPMAVTSDGEWEAWFFANWIPGAQRYPSFAHLMLHEYRSLAQLHNLSRMSYQSPALVTPPPDAPRTAMKIAGRKAIKPETLEKLIGELGSKDADVRKKAVRRFFGKLKGRPRATQRPELIAPLSELFYSAADPTVRAACIAGLTEVAEDGVAPRPLFDALNDADPGVALQGMFALHYFPNPNAVGPLCRFIESRANLLFNETAMSQLGQIGDDRAVPTLVGVLLDTATPFPQSIASAAVALAQCGTRGVDALIGASTRPDARIRLAVAVGLDLCEDPRAEEHLNRLATDSDEHVRKRAKQRAGADFGWLMGKAPPRPGGTSTG